MKKNIFLITQALMLFASVFYVVSCDEDNTDSVLAVKTTIITDVDYTSVTIGGEVTSGKATEKGIVYSTAPTPTVGDSKVVSGSGEGAYLVNITGLTEATVYYFRAYASNGSDVVYGETNYCKTFDPGVPNTVILSVSRVISDSIYVKVKTAVSKGITVLSKGVCWSTSQNPTSDLPTSKTIEGDDVTITVGIGNLQSNTTYYLRSYVTYAGGTIYSDEVEQKTPEFVTLAITAPPTPEVTTAAGGTYTVTLNAPKTITEQGVVYAKTENPTLSTGTAVTSDTTGVGEFPINITGLTGSTKYYIRAYAKIDGGDVFYSDDIQVTTEAAPDIMVSTKAGLIAIADNLGAVYRLTADIDLAGSEWTPIGTADAPFTGKLYGDGHAIKNISINSTDDYVGLFGQLGTGAYIEGVQIVGGNITASSITVNVGAIAGIISGDATITKCSNSATILASPASRDAEYAAGGLVGLVDGTGVVTIISCFNRGDVGSGGRVGGILGAKEGNEAATVSDCYSNATITGTSTSTNDAIAGIIGSVANVALVVENCYSAGNVIASGSTRAIGGIAGGRNMGTAVTVKNSVTLLDKLQMASSSSTYFFRVQGYNAKATLTNNYANSGMEYLYSNTTAKTPTKNTADDQDGADVALADAKTAAWYAANLPTWDFTNTWKIVNGSFPALKWE